MGNECIGTMCYKVKWSKLWCTENEYMGMICCKLKGFKNIFFKNIDFENKYSEFLGLKRSSPKHSGFRLF
jgi:hypothetical protein